VQCCAYGTGDIREANSNTTVGSILPGKMKSCKKQTYPKGNPKQKAVQSRSKNPK